MNSKTDRATQLLLLGTLILSLVGCPDARVNTVSLASPRQQPLFIVISPDSVSYRERMIVGLIEKKMSERGFVKVSSPEIANITVHYNYSIGPSTTKLTVRSSPDFVFGGKRFVFILDGISSHFRDRSNGQREIKGFWQGRENSAGRAI